MNLLSGWTLIGAANLGPDTPGIPDEVVTALLLPPASVYLHMRSRRDWADRSKADQSWQWYDEYALTQGQGMFDLEITNRALWEAGSAAVRSAIRDAGPTVQPGAEGIVMLFGPPGSGKTTLSDVDLEIIKAEERVAFLRLLLDLQPRRER